MKFCNKEQAVARESRSWIMGSARRVATEALKILREEKFFRSWKEKRCGGKPSFRSTIFRMPNSESP
jgi:hypothetical protein